MRQPEIHWRRNRPLTVLGGRLEPLPLPLARVKGGKKSKRPLTREEALAMIAAREEKREHENPETIAYGKLREIVEERGGSMVYQRRGYPYGAWIISLGGKTVIIKSTGMGNLPELDQFYRPLCPNPRTWKDYDDVLVPNGEQDFLAWFK